MIDVNLIPAELQSNILSQEKGWGSGVMVVVVFSFLANIELEKEMGVRSVLVSTTDH